MKLKYIIAAAALILAGCADLDYNEESNRDEQWTYDSPLAGVKSMVFDVYARAFNEFKFAALESNGMLGAMRSSATDESVFASAISNVHKYYDGGWNPSFPMADTWITSYKAIAEIHIYQEKISKIDLSDYRYADNYEMLAQQFELFPYELRFLRAYFYFNLARTYGDVPLVTTTLTNNQANSVFRTPVKEVFAFIVSELDAIAEYLPITYNDVLGQEIGRATRLAALALKARTLLYAASPLFNTTGDKELWLAAARASKEVVDRAAEWGVSLSPYAALSGNDSFFNPEIIFGLGVNADNVFEQRHYPIGVENGNSGDCPSQSLVDAYEYKADGVSFGETHQGTIDLSTEDVYAGLDPRFALTVVKNGDLWPLNSRQQLTVETFNGGFNGLPKYNATPTGYYLRKFVDGNNVTMTNEPTTSRHTWIVMRLAEFYLNYAEAMYNYYGSADAAGEFGMSANDAVNVLRDRADIMMPPFSGSANFAERYERERMVELAFEDHRFWDVRRWKKGAEYFKNVGRAQIDKSGTQLTLTRQTVSRNWDEKYNLYPIPQTELKKNKNLTQNDGWAN